MSAEVLVDAAPQALLAKVDGQYVRPGETLAEFDGLAPSDKRAVTVTLRRLGGNELISSTVIVEQKKDLVLTVAITRDCSGKVCQPAGGNAQRCLAGVCVDARCAAGDEPYCSEAFTPCVDDTNCAAAAPCATATCEAGLCFSDAQNSLCAMDEVCDIPTSTCVPASTPGECMDEGACMRNNGSSGCVLAQCLTEVEACLYTLAADGTVCGTDLVCMSGSCVSNADLCTNGVRDGDESDIDCGGDVCGACTLGDDCGGDDDCMSGICDTLGSNTCEEANACGNGVPETGESCDDGGVIAGDGCDANCLKEGGVGCNFGTECASGSCNAMNVCEIPLPLHCNDGILSGDESAVDCGGSCAGCSGGQVCIDGDDCLSYTCSAGICENEHCGDGIPSGDELGADCGGSCGTACVVYDCSAQTQIPQSECEKLKDYYNALDGPNWGDITDWFSDTMPCGWTGVSCSGPPGNVTELHILETKQHGVLPRNLNTLSALRALEVGATSCCVSRTDVRGTIPTDVSTIGSLESLRLDRNFFSGTIPSELGLLTDLIVLSLQTNQLTGTIPPELGALTNLAELDLGSNLLTGTIPSALGVLNSLTVLKLQMNQLNGPIPTALGALTTLTSLDLQRNQLEQNIPMELGLLTELTFLGLDNNQLVGSIPIELGALVKLDRMQLHSNQLSGSIPREFGALINLTHLQLESNQLTGEIPSEVGALTSLRTFALSSNKLSGSIPSAFGQLVGLTNVSLFANQLSGTIPAEFGGLISARDLSLHQNQLTGDIPAELGNMVNLLTISLYSNQLTGNIPAEIGMLTKLRTLWIEENQLSGTIPPQITNLTALSSLLLCPQQGGLNADMSTGTWLRSIASDDWPAGDSC